MSKFVTIPEEVVRDLLKLEEREGTDDGAAVAHIRQVVVNALREGMHDVDALREIVAKEAARLDNAFETGIKSIRWNGVLGTDTENVDPPDYWKEEDE